MTSARKHPSIIILNIIKIYMVNHNDVRYGTQLAKEKYKQIQVNTNHFKSIGSTIFALEKKEKEQQKSILLKHWIETRLTTPDNLHYLFLIYFFFCFVLFRISRKIKFSPSNGIRFGTWFVHLCFDNHLCVWMNVYLRACYFQLSSSNQIYGSHVDGGRIIVFDMFARAQTHTKKNNKPPKYYCYYKKYLRPYSLMDIVNYTQGYKICLCHTRIKRLTPHTHTFETKKNMNFDKMPFGWPVSGVAQAKNKYFSYFIVEI